MASVEKAYKTRRLAFRLPLDPARLLRARERVRDYLHEHHADPQAIEDLVLALEEAMANVVRHSEAERDLEVTLAFHGYDLVMEVRDYGKGFDVDSFRPDVVPELLRSEGRGLFLISKLTDDLQLRRDGGLTVRAQAGYGAGRLSQEFPASMYPLKLPSPAHAPTRTSASGLCSMRSTRASSPSTGSSASST